MKDKSKLVKKLDVPFRRTNRQALAKVYKWTEPRFHNAELLKTFRTELRRKMTPAEAAFWKLVQGSKLGRKFRRQHSVWPYVLDFYCPLERLGIELDGEVHAQDEARRHDLERVQFIELFNIKVLRFPNAVVFENPEHILTTITDNFGWQESRAN
jgi:very-short-patch-repair endonuclease